MVNYIWDELFFQHMKAWEVDESKHLFAEILRPQLATTPLGSLQLTSWKNIFIIRAIIQFQIRKITNSFTETFWVGFYLNSFKETFKKHTEFSVR